MRSPFIRFCTSDSSCRARSCCERESYAKGPLPYQKFPEGAESTYFIQPWNHGTTNCFPWLDQYRSSSSLPKVAWLHCANLSDFVQPCLFQRSDGVTTSTHLSQALLTSNGHDFKMILRLKYVHSTVCKRPGTDRGFRTKCFDSIHAAPGHRKTKDFWAAVADAHCSPSNILWTSPERSHHSMSKSHFDSERTLFWYNGLLRSIASPQTGLGGIREDPRG